jgi:hypothetical protein
VGAPGDSNRNGEYAGAAYVYELAGNMWKLTAKLIASGGMEQDFAGDGVAIDTTFAVVGAPTGIYSTRPGVVYIFRRYGETWTQIQTLSASDASYQNVFGLRVSMDLNWMVVGAYQDTTRGSGAAYVFRLDDSIWVEKFKLTASDGRRGDVFGAECSIEMPYILIGAQNATRNFSAQGAAYVYKFGPTSVTGSNDGFVPPFSLLQNYPNPFNSTTTISFYLPLRAKASLKVFDLLGRAVATALDDTRSAGTQMVRFDASQLSSGVYLYVLEARLIQNGEVHSWRESRKFVLIR